MFPIMLVLIGLWPSHNFYTLPYFGPDTIYQPEVNEEVAVQQFYQLPDYELTNQYGRPFGSDSLKGEVYLALFYSTNSYAISDITAQLLGINYKYRNEEGINLVCFTLDSEHDTPEVLRKYVDELTEYNAFEGKWQFLTGDQNEINQLIQEGFLIEDFENTTVIWLVDKDGHLRGRYHLDNSSDVKSAIEDIALLKKEMDRRESKKEK